MTVAEFIGKWRGHELKERSAAQEHFIDLCRLVGHPTPAESDKVGESFTFERGAAKATGGEGWADVWKKGFFGWEYKGKYGGLSAAYLQLLRYQGALENPPLLVTCDTDRIIVYTHFSNTPTTQFELTHEGLAEPEQLAILRAVFHDPDVLRPDKTIQAITEEAASKVTTIAQGLRERGLPPERVARFLDRVVFCLFAEDVRLLPNKIFTRLVENTQGKPDRFCSLASQLFSQMATGGDFGADRIEHFNGNLFDTIEALELTTDELSELLTVSRLDWSNIDASIFGTLFERALDPDKRTQLGAHYTSREDIEAIVEPVVLAPLRERWGQVRAEYDALTGDIKKAKDKNWKAAEALMRSFLGELASIVVLDPACGSGNFLFVTLQKLKDLEKEVIIHSSVYFSFFPQVGPWQLRGIEVNAYAHDLAQMTVWIGHLQWHDRHGMPLHERPILRPMSNFELKDAVIDTDSNAEPAWPAADFIVSNPPFLGDKFMRDRLGDGYVDALRGLYKGRVPAGADLCCYWFEKARRQIEVGRCSRAGLLATQSIRGGANREVLKRILATGGIFFAISDRDWILDGAHVHVSMVGFDNGTQQSRTVDGTAVLSVNADLSIGPDVTRALSLPTPAAEFFQGPVRVGDFDISDAEARSWLLTPNPHGRPNSDVLRPTLNGSDNLKRSRQRWVVDFFKMPLEAASRYELPFEHVKRHVEPMRRNNEREGRRLRWWQHGETGDSMRVALAKCSRFLALTQTAKHLVFRWHDSIVYPEQTVIVFARDDEYFFGVLQSKVHHVWARATGTQLREKESGARYTPTTCFESFPFPNPSDTQRDAITAAASELDSLRSGWLNPAEWVHEERLEFPASVDGPWGKLVRNPDANGLGVATYSMIVARDEEAEAQLKKRTLTRLYNEMPTWLQEAHRRVDEAVIAGYGWNAAITDDDMLIELLLRNDAEAR